VGWVDSVGSPESETAGRMSHVHVWVHVAATDWDGRPVVVCRCVCGRTLSLSQIAGWPR
jgi:hypothetical protein